MERIVLVHLSDIHIGSIRNRFYKPSQLRSGYNGHHPLLLGRLQQAILNIPYELNPHLGPEERLNFIVSGDLSCSGLFTDFVLAHSYLRGKVVGDYSAFDIVGLDIPPGCFATVPGNHDHWDGKSGWPQPAHSMAIFGEHFRQTPWKMTLRSKKDDARLLLDLFGVDSNSGLTGWPNINRTACGKLSAAELMGLEQLLIQSDGARTALLKGECQVRALVCHHALSNYGRPAPPKPWLSRLWNGGKQRFIGKNPDPLDPASVRALLALAHKHDVRAVLTGHTHYFHRERFPPGPAAPFTWEIRSGTALQGEPRDGDQEFLVHEIRLEDKAPAPVWRHRRYTYAKNKFNPGPWSVPFNAQ